MSTEELKRKSLVIGILLVVLLAPVVIVGTVVTFLVLTEDLALGRLTPLEFVELYVLELLLFAVFSYGVYRLTLLLVNRQLPTSEGADEPEEDDGSVGLRSGERD